MKISQRNEAYTSFFYKFSEGSNRIYRRSLETKAFADYSLAFKNCVTTVINDVADFSFLLCVLFLSGIGAVVSEIYLHLRTCWLRSSSLVITILTSSNFFSLAIQRSVTYGGENNEVISMNNLNGIAERFGGKENFEQTQLFEISYLDRSLRSSIYNLHFNRNQRLDV